VRRTPRNPEESDTIEPSWSRKATTRFPHSPPTPSIPSIPLDPATGTKRDKKEFSQRQLQLPQKQYMSCRHCNEAEKDEAKAERRKSLDESRELKTGEVHNKGRQVHNNFKSMSRVA
jgi:hypothetical protein